METPSKITQGWLSPISILERKTSAMKIVFKHCEYLKCIDGIENNFSYNIIIMRQYPGQVVI
jgi:hypothetical protein